MSQSRTQSKFTKFLFSKILRPLVGFAIFLNQIQQFAKATEIGPVNGPDCHAETKRIFDSQNSGADNPKNSAQPLALWPVVLGTTVALGGGLGIAFAIHRLGLEESSTWPVNAEGETVPAFNGKILVHGEPSLLGHYYSLHDGVSTWGSVKLNTVRGNEGRRVEIEYFKSDGTPLAYATLRKLPDGRRQVKVRAQDQRELGSFLVPFRNEESDFLNPNILNEDIRTQVIWRVIEHSYEFLWSRETVF